MIPLKRFSITEYTNFLSAFLPQGRLWVAKNVEETKLRSLLIGFAGESKRVCDLFATYLEQLDPNTTDDFVEEWESALGIPDNCIPIADTIEERRDNIILKLTSLTLQTEQDLIDLAAKLGFTITITHINGSFPPHTVPHPVVVGLGGMTTVINGNFSDNPELAEIFQCLVRELIPVTDNIAFTTDPITALYQLDNGALYQLDDDSLYGLTIL